MDGVIQIIGLIIGFLILIQLLLYLYSKFFINKKVEEDDFAELEKIYKEQKQENKDTNFGRFHGVLKKESIMEFLGFDAVRDGMIIRKNGKEFVMVLECNGVNFDLRSENEKLAIEEGFLQFLNALRFPVQLYVQTRKVDFGDVLDTYYQRIKEIQNDIDKLSDEILDSEKIGDKKRNEMLIYEKNRKENLYEYAVDSIQYTEQLSKKKNVLQRKTYVVVSYFLEELGAKVQDYSPEEKEMLVFTELVTRCNNLSGALQASRVSSRLLNSEELVELLFNAFNRDEMENIKLSTFFSSEYQSGLYTKSVDYLEKEKQLIMKEINNSAVQLATSSIVKADRQIKREILNMKLQKNNEIMKKANRLVDSKKATNTRKGISLDTYNRAKKILNETKLKEDPELLKELEKDPELKKQYEALKSVSKEDEQKAKQKENENKEKATDEEIEQILTENYKNREFSQEIEEMEDN